MKRAPQSAIRSVSSGGDSTWKSAPATPSANTGHSRLSVVTLTRQRSWPSSATVTQRPSRSRTAAAGASTTASTCHVPAPGAVEMLRRTNSAASAAGSVRGRNRAPVGCGGPATRSTRKLRQSFLVRS